MVFETHCMSCPYTELLLVNYAKTNSISNSRALLSKDKHICFVERESHQVYWFTVMLQSLSSFDKSLLKQPIFSGLFSLLFFFLDYWISKSQWEWMFKNKFALLLWKNQLGLHEGIITMIEQEYSFTVSAAPTVLGRIETTWCNSRWQSIIWFIRSLQVLNDVI